MPVAYYPAYLVDRGRSERRAYWQHWLALPFWPCGPQWFLWQLLALNVLAAGLHRFARDWSERLGAAGGLGARPSAPVLCGAGRACRRWPMCRWR